MKIKAGMWFTTGAKLMYTYAGWPKLCTKVSGTRVYFMRYDEYLDENNPKYNPALSETKEEYCSIDSIEYVTDDFNKAMKRFDLGTEYRNKTFSMIKELAKEFRDKAELIESGEL